LERVSPFGMPKTSLASIAPLLPRRSDGAGPLGRRAIGTRTMKRARFNVSGSLVKYVPM
jgi:hypothetical protein